MTEIRTARAMFVYAAARLHAMAVGALIVPAPWVERDGVFQAQLTELVAHQCGPWRSESPEELHGMWVQLHLVMGWTWGRSYDAQAKTHPDLVPYAQLDPREREKDAVFLALCEIARQWIRDPDAEGDEPEDEGAPRSV